MDLLLACSDLTQVGPLSFRNTMTLLPLGKKKKRQKIVVGDDNGELNCFECKGGAGDINASWSTKPSDGKEIARLELGGSAGSKEKIFVSTGQQIYGISKKGKGFFLLNTNLTEIITTMFVNDTKIWTGGEYIFNIFDNGRDVGYYMSPDKINDMCCAYVTRENVHDAVIGSQNKKVQVLQDARPVLETQLQGAVNEIHVNEGISKSDSRYVPKSSELVYGTVNGRIGSVNCSAKGIRPTWLLPAEKKGVVNCIQTFDLTHDGVDDILIGRDDGSVQVYSFDMGEDPERQFDDNLGESIRSIDAGLVKTPEFAEIILATFSGRIVSFTSEPVHRTDISDAYGRSKDTMDRESKIIKLRKELDKLHVKLEKEKEKVARLSYTDEMPMVQELKVNSKFHLTPEEAGYVVSVEIPSPIDVVTLQSTVPVDLLDVETNTAIITRTETDGADGNQLLATCRCAETTNRLEFKVRTVEGQYGELQALVVARMEPKCAQSVKFMIKPLSLHHRLYDYELDRPVNMLKFSGSFSIGQMHEWLSRSLPEIPPRVSGSEISMAFRNSFLGSVLTCMYKKGEAIFQSDSVSTIAILKEFITKEATGRKMKINTTFEIVPETTPAVLELLRDKLDYQLSLARKIELIDALKEIKLAGTDGASFLNAEYLDIVNNADKYQKAFKNRPRSLETLYGIVQDLYVDKFKFKGVDARSRLPALNDLLMNNYSFENLLAFFSR